MMPMSLGIAQRRWLRAPMSGALENSEPVNVGTNDLTFAARNAVLRYPMTGISENHLVFRSRQSSFFFFFFFTNCHM